MLSGGELQILVTSFWVAANAVLWSLPFAIATAFALSRPRFPGKLVLDAIAHLPIILPPVLVGFVLLMLLGRRGPIGALLAEAGIQFAFTAKGAAVRKSTRDAKRTWLAQAFAQLNEREQQTLFEAGEIIKRLIDK